MTTYGILSKYPESAGRPATFTDKLRAGLLDGHAEEVRIVPIDKDAEQAAAELNECDIGLIQHEYGVYGGSDGQDVLQIAESLQIPAVAVLHTVPAVPRPHQREVLEGLMDRADAIAVMSNAAADRLVADYAVDAAKIAVIPHEDGRDGPESTEGLIGEFDWTVVSAACGRLASLLAAERAALTGVPAA